MPVSSVHPEYAKFQDAWFDCETFFDGETAVKLCGERYLPKPEQATDTEYKAYVKRAFFFPAIERTVAGLTGTIDRKAPAYKLTPRIEYLEDNADSTGVTLRQFSKLCLDQCFIKGRYGILIDRDAAGGDPYLALYKADDIINWHDDPKTGVTLVVLCERYYEPSATDAFVVTQRKRYRVLRLLDGVYTQELYDEVINGSETAYQQIGAVVPARAGRSLDFIPFVFGNVRSTTSAIDKPPLLDLVRKNAEHYRVSADYANALYFTGNPILWVKGVRPPSQQRLRDPGDPNEPQFKLTLGSSRAAYLPTVDAEIGITECSGHGVSPNHDKAEDIKKEMAVLGARLLEQQRNGVETAETAYLRQSGESSTLVTIVTSVSATIRRALEMADKWQGGAGEDIEFSLNMDFIDSIIDPSLVSTLADLVSKEYISWDTFIYNLMNGELLPPGRTAEEERALIEGQPPMSVGGMDDLIRQLKGQNSNEPDDNTDDDTLAADGTNES